MNFTSSSSMLSSLNFGKKTERVSLDFVLLSTSKVLSTKIICKVCRSSNPIISELCEECANSLPSAAEKLEILLKRVKVAKKKNIEIDATTECDICGVENPMDAVICADEDCAEEMTRLSDEDKLVKLVEAFKRLLFTNA
ncbi:hypothetical protein THRCLA_23103 [Thraustotheca clavata]|uniref:Uncharacterized protein n=1 Tax=Thraustotheca clavata TaxID=74557 RepID=A0A1V9YE83_9STRA|nr:hypothetical protein THRCLA_23103 [Thraustotheca clavata]